MKNNKKGFSLIELSIVLIIIGLLVAGITGGASLIKSAELRSLMSDIRNYQTGLNAYYTATGELPASKDDSEMDFANSCQAWADLANEGVVDIKLTDFSSPDSNGKYSCSTAVTEFSKDNSPASKLKGAFYALGYNAQMGQNVIFIVSGESDTPTTLNEASTKETGEGENKTIKRVTNASITRKDAKFLDDKMDNGVIDSGKIYSFSAGTTGTCAYDDLTTKDCATAVGFGL